jgi:hypothetical protein
MSSQPGGVLCAGTILVDVGKVIDAYPALDHLATIEQISLSNASPKLISPATARSPGPPCELMRSWMTLSWGHSSLPHRAGRASG